MDSEVLMLDLDDVFGNNASVKVVDTSTGEVLPTTNNADIIRKDCDNEK